ncbi:MAG: tyrosine-type recombinase/integrase [Acidimicrobiales bacterium]
MATTFLKAATRWAVETGLVARDPLVGPKRPRAQSPEMKVWTPEQSAAFLVATKTEQSKRTLEVDDYLVAILRAHRARQAAERLAGGESYEDGGWLFCDELGHPYSPGYFSHAWERRIKTLGLPRIRLHVARHSAVSAMLADNVPVTVVSEMLGHASPTVTLGVYAYSLPGAGMSAGERLTQPLRGGAATS